MLTEADRSCIPDPWMGTGAERASMQYLWHATSLVNWEIAELCPEELTISGETQREGRIGKCQDCQCALNGDGSIDFREYVIGLSVLCNPANTEQIIQMAFQLFDLDDDGVITEDEFALIIRSSLGLPDLDVSNLFKEIDADNTNKLSYEEFKDFALKHPEYAKLFTTYLELQRCQLFPETEFASCIPTAKSSISQTSVPRNKVCPQTSADDHSNVSDKKED
ncbi:Lysophosphatidylcholine acyltransferase 2 [Varanus komodoensis]|nr:Lysophosphatidylcholine acyltransferase 2 [Varanus komodoensis]